MALSLGLASTAAAQDSEPTEVEAIIVTGSLIAGTPEDAALPVDVIGAEELAKQGSPSTVDLIKGLAVSNGVLGDTNQFDSRAQGSEGSGSVNLRGLGPTRTLVLINGKRMAINPFALAGAGAVDTNVIPVTAIGRVEVLKDGAAATYGSDAIGGVVNFITRRNFEGFEVNAAYRVIDGSDGDYTFGAIGGWNGDRISLMGSFGYQHRSELSVLERDWATRDYEVNPEGGWSAAGNPSSFIPLASTANRFRDDGCTALGGYAGFSGVTPTCQWHYTEWDNIVETEDRWQLYGQIDIDLSDKTKFHGEAFYARTEVPEWKTSPSYALLATPTGTTSPVPGQYYIPASNPGLQNYIATHGLGIQAYNSTLPVGSAPVTLPAGVLGFGALAIASRPFAMGGNPMFNYGPSTGERTYDAFRIAGDFSGEFGNGVNWSFSAQYSEETGYRSGYDTLVSRYQLALRGYGSHASGTAGGCTAAETANYTTNAGNAALGCYYFNPFSSAVPGNAITGTANPNFVPALENSADLARWFFVKQETEQTSKLFVLEGLLSGQSGWELGGGPVAWAIGAQYRKAGFESWYNDIANRNINPCIDTPVNGSTSCSAPSGPFAFLGVGEPVNLSQDVKAVFAEVVFPITEDLNATVAARYESYGGSVGSTFDPKLSVRWQATEGFALRGSVGTTFRAPTAGQVDGTNFVTSLQNIIGTFRAVDIFGNADLQPETALTYSIGAIFEAGNFKATLDYWSFDFQDPITTEPVGGIVNTVAPGGVLNCAHALIDRFSFSGACSATNIARLRTNTVNGADVKTSGIDLLADYTFDDVLGGSLTFGTSITYVMEYKTDDTFVEGFLVSPSFDAVGLLNYQTTAYPLPQWKGTFYAEWNSGPHNLRWTVRHIDGYTDQRTAPFATGTYRNDDALGTPLTISGGKNIDSFTSHDVTYRVFLPWDVTGTLTIENVLDEDPPFARLDLNYDPFTASGLGRTWKFGLNKKF
jgi:iron complex outermembrane receptor protein